MKKLILTIALTFMATVATLQAEEATVPTFMLSTIDDKNITISETKKGLDIQEIKGKATFIVLFGHRCPPCLKEIPEFINLTNKYEENLSIIAIEAQSYPLDSVKEFAKEHKINYNIVAGINYGEFISYLMKRAGYGRSIPLPLLIALDKNGEVQAVQAGQLSQEELEFLINDLNK